MAKNLLMVSLQSLTLFLFAKVLVKGNEDAKRLFDDLLRNYNRLQRPVKQPYDQIVLHFKLRLSQIIDVHEKDQVMTTSVWLKQEWYDPKLEWDPELYAGVKVLYVPSEMIWVPDIILYNNADGSYQITITTKATVHWNGTIQWEPPAIYKSLCQINVQWFPFDTQTCDLKFGCWTHDYQVLDLRHMDEAEASIIVEKDELGELSNVTVNWKGIGRNDLAEYYDSVEWDLMAIPAKRHVRYYKSCCPDSGQWVDITFSIKLRRRPLFYTVNLILPCIGISFLTILVFYLPSDCGEKVTLSISILVSLTVFFLLLTEIVPATSVVLPLIGKYLLFTMVMVTLSVIMTVIALNLHFRNPTTHSMPWIIRWLFLELLPRYLLMKRPPQEKADQTFTKTSVQLQKSGLTSVSSPDLAWAGSRESIKIAPMVSRSGTIRRESMKAISAAKKAHSKHKSRSRARVKTQQQLRLEALYRSPPVVQAFENVCFIAELLKKQDRNNKIDQDWKYVAMVVDRLFLLIFSITCLAGTLITLLLAPSFYDKSKPIETNKLYNPNGTDSLLEYLS